MAGLVDSLAHPGGNVTGLSQLSRDLSAKRIELLKETLPKMVRMAVLWDPEGPGPRIAFKEYEGAARVFKLHYPVFRSTSDPNRISKEPFKLQKLDARMP